MTRSPFSLFLSALCLPCLVAVQTGCSDGECDPDRLRALLDEAEPGDTVHAGSCVLPGPFTVPAGVRLDGSGESDTTLVAPEGGVAVTLVPNEGGPFTSISDLTVTSDACAGVVARGPGEAVIARVTVDATRGIGIGAEGVTRLVVRDTTVEGSLTPESIGDAMAPLPPFSCGSAPLATHGLVAVDVADLTIEDLSARGLGAFGALLIRSGTTWTGGTVSTNLGAGLEVWGGSAQLTFVELASTRTGLSAIEAYNGVFGGGASVETFDLRVRDGDVYGLFHDDVTAVHHDPTVRDNGFAGLWAQNTTAFEVSGALTDVTDNGFAGVAAVDATGLLLDDVRVAGTVERVTTSGAGTVRAGDGVHLVRSAGVLRDVMLVGNERAGTLLELGGASTDTVTLDNVSVMGSGDAFGVVAQNGTLAPGWDSEVTRDGTTSANDATFTDPLPVGDAVGPPCLPPLGDVDARGLDALVMP